MEMIRMLIDVEKNGGKVLLTDEGWKYVYEILKVKFDNKNVNTHDSLLSVVNE